MLRRYSREDYETDVERIRKLVTGDVVLDELGRAEYDRLVADAKASGDKIDVETDVEVSVRLHPDDDVEVDARLGHSGLHLHTTLEGLLTLSAWYEPEWVEDEWDHNGWTAPVNRYRGEVA